LKHLGQELIHPISHLPLLPELQWQITFREFMKLRSEAQQFG
jgi:hypothetical protein